jgi:uncharacterized protein with PIN domain
VRIIMKVCDRHENKKVKATDEITFRETDERFDLCQECSDEISALVKSEAKVKRGRKKQSPED